MHGNTGEGIIEEPRATVWLIDVVANKFGVIGWRVYRDVRRTAPPCLSACLGSHVFMEINWLENIDRVEEIAGRCHARRSTVACLKNTWPILLPVRTGLYGGSKNFDDLGTLERLDTRNASDTWIFYSIEFSGNSRTHEKHRLNRLS